MEDEESRRCSFNIIRDAFLQKRFTICVLREPNEFKEKGYKVKPHNLFKNKYKIKW